MYLLYVCMGKILHVSVDILFCHQHLAIDIFFVCLTACRFRCCAGVHVAKARGLFQLSALYVFSADIVYFMHVWKELFPRRLLLAALNSLHVRMEGTDF